MKNESMKNEYEPVDCETIDINCPAVDSITMEEARPDQLYEHKKLVQCLLYKELEGTINTFTYNPFKHNN